MRNVTIRLGGVVALTAAAALFASAEALPIVTPDGLRTAINSGNIIEKAQYVRNGRRYCWYDDGWNGTGWYRCGYAQRRGQGWGGHHGWHGWYGPGSNGRPYYGGQHHWGRGCCW